MKQQGWSTMLVICGCWAWHDGCEALDTACAGCDAHVAGVDNVCCLRPVNPKELTSCRAGMQAHTGSMLQPAPRYMTAHLVFEPNLSMSPCCSCTGVLGSFCSASLPRVSQVPKRLMSAQAEVQQVDHGQGVLKCQGWVHAGRLVLLAGLT